MNNRERFLRIMEFKDPDRIPLIDMDGFIEETVRLWCGQGFPASMRVGDYFDFDMRQPYNGNVDLYLGPLPTFVERTIESDEKYVKRVIPLGYTEIRSKEFPMRSYGYTDFPVKTREDWEEMKGRYDPHDIRRYPNSWGDELFEHYGRLEEPVRLSLVWGPGRGPKGGYGMGVEKFLTLFARDPDWVHDIFDTFADFVIEVARPVVEKIDLDYVSIMEDGLAYDNGPLVSPSIYEEFYLPYVKRVLDFFRDHGTRYFAECTSGNFEALMPHFLKAGYSIFWPLESAAGMDATRLRETYGERVRLVGNISRQSLMDGREAVEREFNRKVPPLMESGGFIPAVDDMIMPDISFESFSHFVRLVREYRVV